MTEYLEGKEISLDALKKTMKRVSLTRFFRVFGWLTSKNKGVQLVLDVVDFIFTFRLISRPPCVHPKTRQIEGKLPMNAVFCSYPCSKKPVRRSADLFPRSDPECWKPALMF